jgi:hypothetical protein
MKAASLFRGSWKKLSSKHSGQPLLQARRFARFVQLQHHTLSPVLTNAAYLIPWALVCCGGGDAVCPAHELCKTQNIVRHLFKMEPRAHPQLNSEAHKRKRRKGFMVTRILSKSSSLSFRRAAERHFVTSRPSRFHRSSSQPYNIPPKLIAFYSK